MTMNFNTKYQWRNRNELFIPCLTCAKPFESVDGLRMHQKDTYHYKGPHGKDWTESEKLHAYFDAYYQEHVLVLRDDQRKSRKSVQNVIQNIRRKFTDFHDFCDAIILPAGSTATQTKVIQANEYDFNLVLSCDQITIEEGKKIFYDVVPNGGTFQEYTLGYSPNHLFEDWQCCPIRYGKTIPPGYVCIKSTDVYAHKDWKYKGYLIPRKVQEELYDEIHNYTKKNGIIVSSKPHGPAITMRIRPPFTAHFPINCKDIVDHDIFVDFAACIKSTSGQIAVNKYGWPRLNTKLCLSRTQISKILAADVYLVPKQNCFWYVSFSDAAKVLLRIIDSANTCRRKCHKILKTDFICWHGEQSYAGISTFLFKNHLFWFNEELDVDDCEQYWNDSNIGTCYIDLLTDLARRLDSGVLRNYFNVNENILQDKDQNVLHRLSKRIRRRVQQLRNIYVE